MCLKMKLKCFFFVYIENLNSRVSLLVQNSCTPSFILWVLKNFEYTLVEVQIYSYSFRYINIVELLKKNILIMLFSSSSLLKTQSWILKFHIVYGVKRNYFYEWNFSKFWVIWCGQMTLQVEVFHLVICIRWLVPNLSKLADKVSCYRNLLQSNPFTTICWPDM